MESPPIFYTICTFNYLAQAKVLYHSLSQTDSNIEFYVGLLDELPNEVHLEKIEHLKLLPVSKLAIPHLDEIVSRYKANELCWALKPYYAQYFLDEYPMLNKIIYLDSDVFVYGTFDLLYEQLKTSEIILTPHLVKSVLEDPDLIEKNLVGVAGIYNAGFFAIRRGVNSQKFLQWWSHKLRYYCFSTSGGDQAWLNLVPIFFEQTHILMDIGYNVAWWNLPNRYVSKINNEYFINKTHRLIFFHFSGYVLENEDAITTEKKQGQFLISNRPDLANIFQQYRTELMANGIHYFESFPYPANSLPKDNSSFKNRFKQQLSPIYWSLRRFLSVRKEDKNI